MTCPCLLLVAGCSLTACLCLRQVLRAFEIASYNKAVASGQLRHAIAHGTNPRHYIRGFFYGSRDTVECPPMQCSPEVSGRDIGFWFASPQSRFLAKCVMLQTGPERLENSKTSIVLICMLFATPLGLDKLISCVEAALASLLRSSDMYFQFLTQDRGFWTGPVSTSERCISYCHWRPDSCLRGHCQGC